MAFPIGWPPALPENMYSLRFYKTGNASADFADNAFLFVHPNPNKGLGWSQGIRIVATTADLEYSFDGVNVHGMIPAGNEFFYFDRHEGGISVRSAVASVYEIEAW